ncbi:MAG TPA: class I tRNA ligase family protein [Flavobacteriales bacterium]|nr:class I tRNA ligase family protein [Flavobacteriales bacterium]
MDMNYILVMFPYPSGDGLHIGHAYNYAVMDTYCRWLRLMGEEVFQPFGYDAFGLPAENYARKVGRDPADVTRENIERFRAQMNGLRTQYDERLVTSDPSYQKWTKWLFLQLKDRGLAYKAERPEPYCPSCETVLAKAQVNDRRCERCGSELEQRSMPQWFFRITDYKDRLMAGLDTVDYPDSTKAQQRHWLENLTDWCVSRQRKWGCPIPIEGEDDTLDTFVDSSFYYVRYCDPTNNERLCAPDKYRQVDLCVGGPEHACAHLIYARFIHYFLHDIGTVPVEEPFKRVIHQGMITRNGAKMSKSTGNVVSPSDYEADELRMCLMFIGPYTEGGDWNEGGIKGVSKLLRRMRAWLSDTGADVIDVSGLRQQMDRRVRSMQFNTAVSDWMKFYNSNKSKRPTPGSAKAIRNMLECFAPSA